MDSLKVLLGNMTVINLELKVTRESDQNEEAHNKGNGIEKLREKVF